MSHFIFAGVTLLLCLTARGAEFFVAPDGSDQNPGTSLEQPFATIQKAVDQMQAGDTCFIRGGTYREAISLNGRAGAHGKPLTIKNYADERVIIDGTDKIDGDWSLDEGKIYKTTTNQDISQLFVDGKLMTLARFPNALAFSDQVWHRTAARCGRSRETQNTRGGGRVVDASKEDKSIASTGFSFDGCIALMNFGAHATGTRVVENHEAGSSQFDYKPELLKFKTTLGYFFEGGVGNAERKMLDMSCEWAFDETNKTLYLWADNDLSPKDRNVYGKARTFAFRGDAATRYVQIEGLHFFASTFSFDQSDYIKISNCNFDYYACSKRSLGVLGPSDTACFNGSPEDFCSNIVVYNCEFKYADASAMAGDFVENFLIENNLFAYIDYVGANNDFGIGKPFDPASSLNFDKVADLTYRRNTLSVSGNAQGFSANRYQKRNIKRYNHSTYDPTQIRSITCELNLHTKCGLLHTDGSSMYMPDEHMMESAIRYNWFIDNGQRDFRWDGKNKPLSGVHGNLYRNVAMGGALKRYSPAGGDGFRVKGSFHEVYHNLGIGRGGELNIAPEKGGNEQTVTRNNAASKLTGHPIPGINSNNYGDRRIIERKLKAMLRDGQNWDFRPRADAVELIDKGVPVTCSIKGATVEVNKGFIGEAPDLGAYEFGADRYWIPGRQDKGASMPVPKNAGQNVPLDADLMYLIGLNGVAANVYFGTEEGNLSLIAEKKHPQNIVSIPSEAALQWDKTYYWRVDTVLKDESVIEGQVWSFSTVSKAGPVPNPKPKGRGKKGKR